jgi:CRISPR-associated endonuclease Cas1
MAALPNVPQQFAFRKFPISKSGVLTIYGFGIRVRMQSGHLEIEHGIGPERHKIKLPRVGHRLKRLVLIGSDGFITLEALRWLSVQDVAFVMLERDGKVLIVTGPVRPSDARLRRAQALAHSTGAALRISRDLIARKLAGQEHVAREKLLDSKTADLIGQFKAELRTADSIDAVRLLESQAARAYWSAWSTLPINFPKRDILRIPDHWRSFGTRFSLLTGRPRVATNPPNAILNYLYAILESEARLAAAALGLDPGIGVLHADVAARDSLACDLMEVVRPKVDAFLLDWITRDLLKREWFSERPDGNCRLTSSLAMRLSETAPIWGRAVAPVAEWFAQELWKSPRKNASDQILPTRLTQNRKRAVNGGETLSGEVRFPRTEILCRGCGKSIDGRYTQCESCRLEEATKRMADVARVGRVTAHGPLAQEKRSNTQRRNAIAWHSWNASSQPAWLTEQVYSQKILPILKQITGTAIARAIGVTCAYGSRIRLGLRPHPRHWRALAELVAISGDKSLR